MKLSVDEANRIFDVIVSTGNLDVSNEGYVDYQRSEFVNIATRPEGMNEYWYSSKCGSSFKLYPHLSFPSGVGFKRSLMFVAQTYNPIHEKTIVEDMNKDLALLDL